MRAILFPRGGEKKSGRSEFLVEYISSKEEEGRRGRLSRERIYSSNVILTGMG